MFAVHPSGWKHREAGIGVHFLQAQPGRHVFYPATGEVVWFYQKRRPYMIVKAAHRRPEGLVSRLKSDGSPLTSDCLNIVRARQL